MSNDIFPATAAERKTYPVYSGVLKYFPDALAAVAHLSWVGNEQHNAGEPLHWSREKSSDHHDCATRHLMEAGKIDTDGVRHSAKAAWRALAILQLEIEGAAAVPGTAEVKHDNCAGCKWHIEGSTCNLCDDFSLWTAADGGSYNADGVSDGGRHKADVVADEGWRK